MTDLRVAAVQLSSQDDLHKNLSRAVALIEEASVAGARLIVLPEILLSWGRGRRQACPRRIARREAERADRQRAVRRRSAHGLVRGRGRHAGKIRRSRKALQHLRGLRARRHGRRALPQGAPLRRRSRRRTALPRVGQHDAGTEPVVLPVLGFQLGLSVCYDLRFPELYRKLVDRGADVIVVPAAFTLATGKDHWHVLLRARAIESQAYVIAAGQWGAHPRGRRTYGKSLVVDPWGDVIAQQGKARGSSLPPSVEATSTAFAPTFRLWTQTTLACRD